MPPAASITAAANWVGATARSTCCAPPAAAGRANARAPSNADAAAAHRHTTAATSMGQQYESPPASAARTYCYGTGGAGGLAGATRDPLVTAFVAFDDATA